MKKSINILAVLPLLAAVVATTSTLVSADERMMYSEDMMQLAQSGRAGYGMPGYGCGMGMMGGPGMGYGPGAMMGRHGAYGMGMGMGMMGGLGPMAMPDLSDAQRDQMEKIQAGLMKKQRALMRQVWDEQEKLWDLSSAEKRDPAAIGKAYSRLADRKRQMLEARIHAENEMAAVLTKEQKAKMRRGFGRGTMDD